MTEEVAPRTATLLEEAQTHYARGEIDAAIPKFCQHLNGDFFDHDTLFMLGTCFQMKGMNGLSAVILSAAVDARSPKMQGSTEAMMNLAGAYRAEHRFDMAERIWNDALRIEKDSIKRAQILGNLAGLHVNEGKPERAVEYADKALKEDPTFAHAKASRGMACLELGRWREGFEGWKATYLTGDRHKKIYPGAPEWDGSAGKRLIVWGDQGVGDELFYGTNLHDVAAISEKVIFDCHPRLEGLFQRTFPDFEVHGTRKDLTVPLWMAQSGANASVALADLPCFLRLNGGWSGKPYLKVDPRSDEPLLKRAGPLRIGLSWTGGTKRTRTALRSLRLHELEPILLSRPDAQWFSLQYTPDAARDVCELEEKTGIRIAHYPSWVECRDYDRTASFVGSLDLVITVCTTVHHLGGALGVPTWTLVPSRPSWRYMVKGETLPWYSSVRLFRQIKDDDWHDPIRRVAAELRNFGMQKAA